MMKRWIILAGSVTGALALTAIAGPTVAAPSRMDQTFVQKASQAGIAEVDAAQLAVDRAVDGNVRGFAQEMIMDHSRLNRQLGRIATAEELPTPVYSDAKDRAAMIRLSALSGADFDRGYMQQQIAAHRAAVALFKSEEDRGRDPRLRQFAASALPIIESHQSMGYQVAASLVPTPSLMAHRMQRHQ
jgi:putative membrane protein